MYYNDLRNFRSFVELNGNIYLYYFLNFAMTFLRFSLQNTNSMESIYSLKLCTLEYFMKKLIIVDLFITIYF